MVSNRTLFVHLCRPPESNTIDSGAIQINCIIIIINTPGNNVWTQELNLYFNFCFIPKSTRPVGGSRYMARLHATGADRGLDTRIIF